MTPPPAMRDRSLPTQHAALASPSGQERFFSQALVELVETRPLPSTLQGQASRPGSKNRLNKHSRPRPCSVQKVAVTHVLTEVPTGPVAQNIPHHWRAQQPHSAPRGHPRQTEAAVGIAEVWPLGRRNLAVRGLGELLLSDALQHRCTVRAMGAARRTQPWSQQCAQRLRPA